MVRRGEVYWVNLDPTVGTEIKKTRPALVVSPDDMNAVLPRVIVAPLTSKGQPLGCRPEVNVAGKKARILLDQVRCVDKIRLTSKIGEIDHSLWHPDRILLDQVRCVDKIRLTSKIGEIDHSLWHPVLLEMFS